MVLIGRTGEDPGKDAPRLHLKALASRLGQRSIISGMSLKLDHAGTDAVRWPLLLQHLTGLGLYNEI